MTTNARTSIRFPGISWPDRTTWLVGLGTAIGYANTAAGSWIFEALTRSRHFDVDAAGFLVSAETLATAIGMLALAPIAPRLPRKLVMICALALMLIGQVVTVVIDGFWPLIVARAVVGVAFGTLYTVALANGAGSRDPQRVFAGAAAIALVVGTTFNPLLGYGSSGFGLVGVLASLSFYCVVFAVPVLLIPFTAARSTAAGPATIASAPIDWTAAMLVFVVMALLTVATNGVLLFTVQIAARVGLNGTALGGGLAIVSLVSALGGVLASRIGTRLGTLPPLAAGLGLMGPALLAISSASNLAAFWMLMTGIVALFWFLSPYLFGLASAVDPDGRVASVTASAKIAAGAGGSAGASVIAKHFGLAVVGYGALALCVAAIVIAYFATQRIETRASADRHG